MLSEIRKQTITLATGALAFVAAFVWKDAVQAWLKPLYADSKGATGLTIAALVVTVIVVILTILITKIFGKDEEE
jgi:hypothetical protein